MSRVAASVHVVATDGPAGRRGATVTSVASVSDDPATLLVCLNISSPLNGRFEENGVFSVNVLGVADEPVARAFAGEGKLETEARFATGTWLRLETGAPVLASALVAFDCRLTAASVVATHRVLIGQVVAVHAGAPGAGLVYRGRRYLAV